jgi:hypothetical protein
MAALFIQSGNALVSRVANWVGAVPSPLSITLTNSTGGYYPILTPSANPMGQVFPGDFIGPSLMLPYTIVVSVTSTSILVCDPDGVWANSVYPSTILKLPSQSSMEILTCIQNAEMNMRVIELPALRSDPYHPTNPSILLTDEQGMAPIPTDMNWPILFFQQTPSSEVEPNSPAASLGPWIMYDRVGDREIIRRKMIDQLYVRPFGVPRVIRASFSEVGGRYVFTPNPGKNVEIKAYYQRSYKLLFSPTNNNLDPIVQNNEALASFPEGYLYSTLSAYYDKNKNTEEAQKWKSRFDDAYGLIQDQNFKDKWRGGDRHLSSEFQPRTYRYNFK